MFSFQKLICYHTSASRKRRKTLKNPTERCSVRRYLIDRRQVHYLRFLLEAYPGLAVVSTEDSALGLVAVAIAPGCEQDVLRILDAEKQALNLREVSEP